MKSCRSKSHAAQVWETRESVSAEWHVARLSYCAFRRQSPQAAVADLHANDGRCETSHELVSPLVRFLFNRALPAELFHPIYTFPGRGQSHTQTCLACAHTPQCSCNPARFIIVGVISCPPLREELGEFKLWPTYTLFHFALCAAHKAQCMTSARTHSRLSFQSRWPLK